MTAAGRMSGPIIFCGSGSVLQNHDLDSPSSLETKKMNQPCDRLLHSPSLSLEQRFESLTMMEVVPQRCSSSVPTSFQTPTGRSSNELGAAMGECAKDDKSVGPVHPTAQKYCSSCTRISPVLMRQQVSECANEVKSNDKEKVSQIRQQIIRLL
jgi:hypothetical protein